MALLFTAQQGSLNLSLATRDDFNFFIHDDIMKELKSEVLRLIEENMILRDKIDTLTQKLRKS